VKVLADTHVAPPLPRLPVPTRPPIVVPLVPRHAPGLAPGRGPAGDKLSYQLTELQAEARALAANNAVLYREVQALHSDVSAIEDRARADLGMVYPDEVVLRVRRTEPLPEPAPKRAAQGLAR